ncbi:MAG: hypothetical protein KGR26_12280 [Cyanobacteria bacterium REEB65]|nr:hypothetical protein [Cyanobacteria bacterium REEB65]
MTCAIKTEDATNARLRPPLFDVARRCPKCGFNAIAALFCGPGNRKCMSDQLPDEHFHRVCGLCTYQWPEACPDFEHRATLERCLVKGESTLSQETPYWPPDDRLEAWQRQQQEQNHPADASWSDAKSSD